MALQSKTFYGTVSQNAGKFTAMIVITENSVNTAANTSNVTVEFKIKRDKWGWQSGIKFKGGLGFDPNLSSFSYSPNWSFSSSGTVTIKAVTQDIPHSPMGDGSVYASGWWSTSGPISPGNVSVRGEMALTKINRQPSIDFNVNNKRSTSFNIHSWHDTNYPTPVEFELYNGSRLLKTSSSPDFLVTGLAPSTTYNLKLRGKSSAGIWSNYATEQARTAPSPNATLTYTGKTTSSLSFNWSMNGTASRLWYSFDNGASYAETPDKTDRNLYFGNLKPNTTYKTKLKILLTTGEYAYSNMVTQTTGSLVSISNVTVTNTKMNNTTVNYSMSAGINRLAYSINNGGWIETSDIDRSLYLTKLLPNTNYSVKLKGRDSVYNTWGYESPQAYFTTPSTPTVASVKGALVGTLTMTGSIYDRSVSAVGYIVRENDETVIKSLGTIAPDAQSNYSTSFSFTEAELNSLYSLFPTSTKVRFRGKIRQETDGTVYAGFSPVAQSTIPDANPTLGAITVKNAPDSIARELSGSDSKFIQNITNPIVSYPAMVTQKKATAKNYQVGGDNLYTKTTTSLQAILDPIPSTGNAGIWVQAYDSRDLIATSRTTAEVIPYNTPNVASASIVRKDIIGTEGIMNLNGSYFDSNFGSSTKNTITKVTLYITNKTTKAVEEVDITSQVTVSAGTGSNNTRNFYMANKELSNVEFILGTEYSVTISFKDRVKEIFSPIVINITGGKVSLTINRAKRSAAIGKIFTREDLPEGSLDIVGSLEVGNSLRENNISTTGSNIGFFRSIYSTPRGNTLADWKGVKPGYYFVHPNGIEGQPSDYGIMQVVKSGDEGNVLWYTQTLGAIYRKSWNYNTINDWVNTKYTLIKDDHDYPGLVNNNGEDTGWIRTTLNGLLPYQGDGASTVGTQRYPFNEIFSKQMKVQTSTERAGLSVLEGSTIKGEFSTTPQSKEVTIQNHMGGSIIFRPNNSTSNQATLNKEGTFYVKNLNVDNKSFLDRTYPIGALYESTSATSPASLFGGTWEKFGGGRVIVGHNPSESEFNTVGEIGGSKRHTLSVSEIPKHSHGADIAIDGGKDATNKDKVNLEGYGDARWWNNSARTLIAGGGSSHNNLQPYLVAYRWRRIS